MGAGEQLHPTQRLLHPFHLAEGSPLGREGDGPARGREKGEKGSGGGGVRQRSRAYTVLYTAAAPTVQILAGKHFANPFQIPVQSHRYFFGTLKTTHDSTKLTPYATKDPALQMIPVQSCLVGEYGPPIMTKSQLLSHTVFRKRSFS